MPKLTILLCTFNGGSFLNQQLDSIESQDYKDWNIVVSDDGSKDDTLSILNNYRNKWGHEKMKILNGPQEGFGKNFLFLINNNDENSDFFAFADQDDIWESKKLSTGINFIKSHSQSTPCLYCSRTKLIDKSNNIIGSSPLFAEKPSIYNALVQSIAGGNTMIINKKTLNIATLVGNSSYIVSHDWLIYQLVTSVNGKVKYDKWPSVKYRQHDNNKIGNNMKLNARLKRLYFFMRGDLKKWINYNLIVLEKIEDELSNEAKQAISHLIKLRKMRWYEIIFSLNNIRFYRQTKFGHLALIIGFIFKRV